MFSSLFTVVSAALVLGVAANPIVERQSGETHTVTVCFILAIHPQHG
jgi:hypothetical protein